MMAWQSPHLMLCPRKTTPPNFCRHFDLECPLATFQRSLDGEAIRMKLAFSKYHGAGNDFIMVDNRSDDRRLWDALDQGTIARLCQRALGIGADGLIQVIKHDSDVPYTMGYFNADGTPAEMCGNGLRCTMQYLSDLGEPVKTMPEVKIMTGAGPVTSRFADDERIQVSMPIPSFLPKAVRINTPGEVIQQSFNIPGLAEAVTGTAVGVGNPHFVMFNNDMWEGEDVHGIGSRMMVHKDLFPEGVNVGFARKESPNACALVVYERGVGPTLACGSGAIAAVAAGIREGKFNHDQTVEVRMPGGMIAVTIGTDWTYAVLEGTAVKVYDGVVDI